jgi:hypothetical protein
MYFHLESRLRKKLAVSKNQRKMSAARVQNAKGKWRADWGQLTQSHVGHGEKRDFFIESSNH